jgi:hypothetical protein
VLLRTVLASPLALALGACGSNTLGGPPPRAPESARAAADGAAEDSLPAFDVSTDLMTLLRGLPSDDANEAAKAFAARLADVSRRCRRVHIDRRGGEVTASFGLLCPTARGMLVASFRDAGAAGVEASVELDDFWVRGSDLLKGSWSVIVSPEGEPSAASPPPWRDVPGKSRRPVAAARAAKSSGPLCKGKGCAVVLPLAAIAALAKWGAGN